MTTILELADGRTAAVETYGDEHGAPVLFLHGFSDSRLGGAIFAPAASRGGTRLLCPDRPGIGRSTGALRSFSDFGAWFRLLVDALGLERAPVVGVSGGGPFALAAARFAPERVERVVLVSALGPPALGSAGMPAGQRAGIVLARHAPRPAAVGLSAVALVGRLAPRAFLALVGFSASSTDARAVHDPASIRTVVEPFVEAYRAGPAGVAGELRLLLRDWGFEPGEVELPVRVEHGLDDVTVPPSTARALASWIPNAELCLRPGAGHFTLAPRHADELLAAARGDDQARALR